MPVARSILFNFLYYAWHAFWPPLMAWALILPRRQMEGLAILPFLRGVRWLEETILGLRAEILGRDRLPDGPFILASKHQSTFETYKLHFVVREPGVILKRELMYIPVWGWYAARAGLIPIDRRRGGGVIPSMIAGARKVAEEGRAIVIYPQGTRVAPGVQARYRIGVGRLYEALGVPVVPMAVNSGVFWPRQSFFKKPGRITIELLDPIPADLPVETFMARLEHEIETASNRLSRAVGGPETPLRQEVLESAGNFGEAASSERV